MSSFANQADQDQGQAQGTSFADNATQDPEVVLTVGERQYKSLDDIKAKIENADNHIKTTEAENAEMREELAKLRAELQESKSVDDVLDRMKNKEDTQQGLSQEEIEALLVNKLSEAKQSDARQSNHTQCQAALAEAYGEEGITKLSEIATELGMTMEGVDDIAYSNPTLFKKLFIAEGSAPATSNNVGAPSTVRTSNFQTTPEVDDVKAPMELGNAKARTNNYLKALEKHLANNQ